MIRNRLLWAAILAIPLAIGGGLVYANSQEAKPFTCPVTGEELPCERCCPLNGDTPAAIEPNADGEAPDAAGGFICPITGEPLGCPNCCPLNKAKK